MSKILKLLLIIQGLFLKIFTYEIVIKLHKLFLKIDIIM